MKFIEYFKRRASPLNLDRVIQTFEQSSVQSISGRIRLPRETANVADYLRMLGITLVDDSDMAKYEILLEGKVPRRLIQAGVSPVAIYGGYFDIPPNGISLDDYAFAFNTLDELRICVPGFKGTRVYGATGLFPHTLTARLSDGTEIEAKAVNPIGPHRGLTTEDSYTLTKKSAR